MRRTILALVAVLAVVMTSGCAARINKVMMSWERHHYSDLIASWGPPQQVFDDGTGGRILVWTATRSYTVPGQATTYTTGIATIYDNYIWGSATSRTTYNPAQTYGWTAYRMFWTTATASSTDGLGVACSSIRPHPLQSVGDVARAHGITTGCSGAAYYHPWYWDFIVTVAGVFMGAFRLNNMRIGDAREERLMETVAESLANWNPDGIRGFADCKSLYESEIIALQRLGMSLASFQLFSHEGYAR